MKIITSSAFRMASRTSTKRLNHTVSRIITARPLSLLMGTSNTTPASYNAPTLLIRRSLSSSDGSHDDFAPKRKVVDDIDEAVQMIGDHIKSNHIMLYMKGSPAMPMCGFSAKVVKILQEEGVDFASVNVLDYPAIREGVKKFSEWPTIPQLYVNAEFVGGCDIVTSMHESGELKELLLQQQNTKEE